jgi:hypothetical protein
MLYFKQHTYFKGNRSIHADKIIPKCTNKYNAMENIRKKIENLVLRLTPCKLDHIVYVLTYFLIPCMILQYHFL